jgi:predicted amidophosphoribosyltransferase
MEENILSSLDSCKHEFCKICIKKWSKLENTCPICKKRFNQILTLNNNISKYNFRKR